MTMMSIIISGIMVYVIRHKDRLLIIFVYLGFYVAFNTVQVISRRVVGRAEKPVHRVR